MNDKEKNQLAEDFQTCLGHEAGDRLLRHLKAHFAVGLPVFVKASHRAIDDPMIDAAVKDGNHEVVRYIEATLNLTYSPE